MRIEIMTESLKITLFGVSSQVKSQTYSETGFQLMDVLWQEINKENLKHKGLNHWIYEDEDTLFIGVELQEYPRSETKLVRKEINIPRYAYWKHIGPYHQLGTVHADMHQTLEDKGLKTGYPVIEIYGHWQEDEMKLETDVMITLA